MSKKNPKNQGVRLVKRPESFHNYAECVKWLKKSVYMIVRGREIEIDKIKRTKWYTLGTGFLVAPNRFITACHVINDLNPAKDDTCRHKEGDVYYLLRHDDENNIHWSIISKLQLKKQIFLEETLDLAIIYLEDSFYKNADTIFADKNDFIRIFKDFLPIGSEIGVLGYPLCSLMFNNQDIKQPLIGNILLRTDSGVINCRYQYPNKSYGYEFTLAFNPGNSGGPIFDVKTGRLISIAKGYRAIPIKTEENIISEEGLKLLKAYKEKSFIEVVHATYSVGFATPSFIELFKRHNIIN